MFLSKRGSLSKDLLLPVPSLAWRSGWPPVLFPVLPREKLPLICSLEMCVSLSVFYTNKLLKY